MPLAVVVKYEPEKSTKNETIVNSSNTLREKLGEIREAQKKYAEFTQEQVDSIFKAAALAANRQRIP
ncbi:MAG: hypothetical protein AB7C97_13460, partial [Oscillospiraceae bacterium]